MDYAHLDSLKKNHPAWRLLSAGNAPLIIGFFHKVFIAPNRRALPWSELVARLDDYLYGLRQVYGGDQYPKTAREYLDDWSSDAKVPYLSKRYAGGDDPECDLTPATEKAIEWLRGLEQREFVGTESRLLSMFRLLEDVALNTEQDAARRIAELEKQKQAVEAEIRKVREGRYTPFDATQVKERFFQLEDLARRLLADFRQMEDNFRRLDSATRQRIATSDKTKGELLDEIFAEQDFIRASDQGKSFLAFWEFLMAPRRQAELEDLLERMFALDAVRELRPDSFLRRIKFYLLEAGDKVYQTNNRLVEQLRRYLDEQSFLEDRRIIKLIRAVEKHALALKAAPPAERDFAELDDSGPQLDLPLARGLYRPVRKASIQDCPLPAEEAEVDMSALFRQFYIDLPELQGRIRRLLRDHEQVSLAQVIAAHPLEKGLAELLAYLYLADRDARALVAEDGADTTTLEWRGHDGTRREARLPQVIFTR